MQKLEIIIEPKNQDPEQIKWLEVRFPNQKNRLWVTARYWFLFGMRIGVVKHYD